VAILLWGTVLAGFGFLWRPQATNIPPQPLEAQIIEVPGEGPTGGSGAPSVGGRKVSTSPGSTHPVLQTPLRRKPRVSQARSVRLRDEDPIAKSETKTTDTQIMAVPIVAAPPAQPASSAVARSALPPRDKHPSGERNGGKRDGTGVSGGAGTDSGGIGRGSGTGGTGPIAIYAPAPTIPDDMRNEVLEVVAVAHFRVLHDGRVIVSLVKSTNFSRLNETILCTLREWRFRPAMNNGTAVDSEAEIRLLITVR